MKSKKEKKISLKEPVKAIPAEKKVTKLTHFHRFLRPWLWFIFGAALGLIFLISFGYMYFQYSYTNKVYPGIFIAGVNFSGKTEGEVRNYFQQKNAQIPDSTITLHYQDLVATTSARELHLGYDASLLAHQAISLGRSPESAVNFSTLVQSYLHGLYLPPAYTFAANKLDALIKPFQTQIHVDPKDAAFEMKNGRVTTFQLATDGKDVDTDMLKTSLTTIVLSLANAQQAKSLSVTVPTKVVHPTSQASEQVQKMGIHELVASGTSLFQGSIESRIYNINLASSRLNGVLIPPGATFSFDQSVGDISAATGYKQAYVIENGHTVLGDGGGVCQVSTTMFRAALNAGLPIVERNPHAYRVHYYEEDQPVGIDAAVYYPTVDLKFKNDTPGYLLIQTVIDLDTLRLTFNLYGTNDGRQVTIDHPVVLSQTPAPPDLYQDDPTLPVGQVKQIDFSAAGANVYFTREVYRDGKQILSDKFISNYRPWQAVFLKGTKT